MVDEVVSYAFSHGFHPQHSKRVAGYWGEALVSEDAKPLGELSSGSSQVGLVVHPSDNPVRRQILRRTTPAWPGSVPAPSGRRTSWPECQVGNQMSGPCRP